MPYTKRYYIEITTLEPIDNNHFYNVIDRNYEKSFIKLTIFDTILHEENKFKEIDNYVKKNKQIPIM